MMRIVQADFNNVREDGTLYVATRRLNHGVAVGQIVVVQDPGDEARYEAAIIQVDESANRIQLKVDWNARPGFAHVHSSGPGRWLLPDKSSRGAAPIVGRVGELVT